MEPGFEQAIVERPRPLAIKNVEIAYTPLNDKYPPILTLKQAAELSHLSPFTLKRHFSEGKYADCVSRGKPVRIWRDRFVLALMK